MSTETEKLETISMEALASFRCTQDPRDYPADHWSRRLENLIENKKRLAMTTRTAPHRKNAAPVNPVNIVKMKNKIETGDIVSVQFHAAKYTLCNQAKVMHKPCSIGDSWGFQDLESGKIHYVSEGCTVTLIENTTPTEI